MACVTDDVVYLSADLVLDLPEQVVAEGDATFQQRESPAVHGERESRTLG